MIRLRSVLLLLAVFLIATGCTETALTPLPNEASDSGSNPEPDVSEARVDASAFLNRLQSCNSPAAADCGDKGAPGPPATGFTSPLFGLATAPNGDILVADAGAGIATRTGALDIPLPGVTDMSPLGRGSMWALKGLTGDPGEDTGQGLYRATRGTNRLIADLFAFEKNYNPDGADLIDSNPFDVHALGGRAALVADAGGNDLLRVTNQGDIEVLAVLPDELVPTAHVKSLVGCPAGPAGICGLPDMIPAQPVATSVAVGPNGYYYVGELKGFPAPTGESNIWKIAPDASGAQCGSSPDCVKVFDGGFTSIIDLAFDASGTLHVAELDENSWFAVELGPSALAGGTINACTVGTTTCSEVATGLPILTAITFGTDGALWATENALLPGSATVVRVP